MECGWLGQFGHGMRPSFDEFWVAKCGPDGWGARLDWMEGQTGPDGVGAGLDQGGDGAGLGQMGGGRTGPEGGAPDRSDIRQTQGVPGSI